MNAAFQRSFNSLFHPSRRQRTAMSARALPGAKDAGDLLLHTRVEWQAMLESVLTGEVLKSEAKRLLGNNTFLEPHDRNQHIWLALRALRSGRSLHQESLVVDRERKRIDNEMLEQVITFVGVASPLLNSSFQSSAVDPSLAGDLSSTADPSSIPDHCSSTRSVSARDQVLAVLAKVDEALSLYPTEKALILAHPLYTSEALQTKLRTLYTWLNVTTQVRMELDVLERWIRMEPSTPSTVPPATPISPTSSNNADASHFPFLERILKESGMQKTMERRLMDDVPRFLEKVRINILPVAIELQRLGLVIDYSQIQRLAEVPVCVVQEILRLRLSYAKRISETPSYAMLEQLREDFRSVLVMAFRIRESYFTITTVSSGWDLHPMLCKQDYSALVIECVKFYFRLLRWRLSGISAEQRMRYSFMNVDDASSTLASSQGNPISYNSGNYRSPITPTITTSSSNINGNKLSLVKDTEILESEWEFFINLINIAGTPLLAEDRCIATGFCNLTLQLFEDIRALLVDGVSVVVPDAPFHFFKMSHKLLEVVKTKARNTKDFYRLIHNHFERSMEWSLDDNAILDSLIQLQHSGHILIRPTDVKGQLVSSPFLNSNHFTTTNTNLSTDSSNNIAMVATPLIFASPALAGRKRLVKLLITRAMPWYTASNTTPASFLSSSSLSATSAAAAAAFTDLVNTSTTGSQPWLGDPLQETDYGYVVILTLPTQFQGPPTSPITHSLDNDTDNTPIATTFSDNSIKSTTYSPDVTAESQRTSILHLAIAACINNWRGSVMDVNLGTEWECPSTLNILNTTNSIPPTPLSSSSSYFPSQSLPCSPFTPSLPANVTITSALSEIKIKPGTFRLVAPHAEHLEAVKTRFLTATSNVLAEPNACHIRNERSSHLRSLDLSMQAVGQISRQLLRILLNGVKALRERIFEDKRANQAAQLHLHQQLEQDYYRRHENETLSLAITSPTETVENSTINSSSHHSVPIAVTEESLSTDSDINGGRNKRKVVLSLSLINPTIIPSSQPCLSPTLSTSEKLFTQPANTLSDSNTTNSIDEVHDSPTTPVHSPHLLRSSTTPVTRVDHTAATTVVDDSYMGIDLMETYYSFVSDFGQRLLRLIHCPLVCAHVTRDLIAFAMDWISFTCSCHVRQDKKTFRWALLSLEFTMTITKGSAILALTNDEFLMLRARVGQAIQVLISHFEMEGPRASLVYPNSSTTIASAEATAAATHALQEKGLSAIAQFMQQTAESVRKQAMYQQSLQSSVGLQAFKDRNVATDEVVTPETSDTISANFVDSQLSKLVDIAASDTTPQQLQPSESSFTVETQIPGVEDASEVEHIEGNATDSIASASAKSSISLTGNCEELMYLRKLRELDNARTLMQQKTRLIGRVLNTKLNERSLASLSSSSSNISIRWQHGKFIGGGTYGSVYLAINLDTGELLAVKEIRIQDTSNFAMLKNMVKEEMKIMEQLSHPNIVQYYGIEVHRDKVYLFMEYVANGALTNLLGNGGIENEDIIRHYAHQIILGLEYLHSRKIVHRDIKPDNILVDQHGNIKLVDFGASKILSNQKTIIQQQAGGKSLIGTPNYMAPEVILSSKGPSLIGSQDIWSLGCVIYELYTGKAPWSHLDNQWAIIYHCAMSAPPLPESSNISEEGQDFMRKCFTLSPCDRPTAKLLLDHPFVRDIHTTYMLKNALPSSSSSTTATGTISTFSNTTTPSPTLTNINITAQSNASLGPPCSDGPSIPSPPLSPMQFASNPPALSVYTTVLDNYTVSQGVKEILPSAEVEIPQSSSNHLSSKSSSMCLCASATLAHKVSSLPIPYSEANDVWPSSVMSQHTLDTPWTMYPQKKSIPSQVLDTVNLNSEISEEATEHPIGLPLESMHAYLDSPNIAAINKVELLLMSSQHQPVTALPLSLSSSSPTAYSQMPKLSPQLISTRNVHTSERETGYSPVSDISSYSSGSSGRSSGSSLGDDDDSSGDSQSDGFAQSPIISSHDHSKSSGANNGESAQYLLNFTPARDTSYSQPAPTKRLSAPPSLSLSELVGDGITYPYKDGSSGSSSIAKRRFSSPHLPSPLPAIRRLLTVIGIGNKDDTSDIDNIDDEEEDEHDSDINNIKRSMHSWHDGQDSSSPTSANSSAPPSPLSRKRAHLIGSYRNSESSRNTAAGIARHP